MEFRLLCGFFLVLVGNIQGLQHSQNCKVTEWAGWEECDNPCGIGSRRRIRKVETFPENGGKHCPVLKQRQACVGDGLSEECLQQDLEFQGEELRERGQILPVKYGIFRSSKEYAPWKGILKNLYGRNYNQILKRATYYSTYLITSTRDACFDKADAPWANFLKKGVHVCVECQPTAMDRDRGLRCIGHGVKNMLTEWSAVNVPHCRGEWTMQKPHESGTCQQDNENAFIFI
ncbi:somatomedin-B and thrombospondin type-1 domain-containing protein-like isoform X2 [Gigantopelta aegis]|uniref:somatomedin-B and thrombospondin type-1 domain-containing protein-like isoform X2 n=1 Tax=Gigantopelta aegis TaxID=1735272 RepID=UPI001B8899B2|nr:somatomedin-B and thrombospondin type-1 domain-containing protein-like isoform X2 [Gigantopelta aegis]